MEETKEEDSGLPRHAATSDRHRLSESGTVVDDISSDFRSLNTAEPSSSRPPPVHSAAKPPPIPAPPVSQKSSVLPSASALSHEPAPNAGPGSASTSMQRSSSLSSIFPQALSEVPAPSHDEIRGNQVISHPLMFEGGVNQGEEQALSPQSLSRHSSYRSRSPSFGPSSPTASASSSTGVPGSSRIASRAPSFSKDIVAEVTTNFQERRGSLFPFRKVSVQDVSSDISSLQKLARQGSWRAIIEKVKETRKRDIVHSLDEQLSYTSHYVLALMKLRNYGAAADELAALGDLDSPKFRYEDTPTFQPEKSGSMVPFGLRWLHAILPRWLGETAKATDRLYELLAHCNKKIDHLEQVLKRIQGRTAAAVAASELDLLTGLSLAGRPLGSVPSDSYSADEGEQVRSNSFNPDDATDDLDTVLSSAAIGQSPTGCQLMLEKWRRRQEMVLHTALAHHLNEKEFLISLNLLENLLKSRASDPVLLSRYGYVQLLVGDIDGAKATFSAVETVVAKQGVSQGLLANLVSRNRGLLLFALKQYPAASKKFDAVLKQDPGDEIAANNKALCLMYSRDLVGATQVLEDVLQRSPLTALHEPLVLNLCSMYELSSMNSTEAKRTLSSWIMRIAPDDFDMTCTRL